MHCWGYLHKRTSHWIDGDRDTRDVWKVVGPRMLDRKWERARNKLKNTYGITEQVK